MEDEGTSSNTGTKRTGEEEVHNGAELRRRGDIGNSLWGEDEKRGRNSSFKGLATGEGESLRGTAWGGREKTKT